METPAPHRMPVDEHFVCEDSGVEVVRGTLRMVPPANEPHATTHFSLAVLLGTHLAPGWRGAIDMLTRTSADSDFAPDASIFPEMRDPRSGRRQLEELAFEVADSQTLDDAGDKARELRRRGVRRVFCIALTHRRVLEWSTETDAWSPLPENSVIEDRCLARGLPVRALLDTATNDEAIVAALVARGSPAIRAVEARGEARGEVRGRAEALLAVLGSRGLALRDDQAARIRGGTAPELDAWLARAALVRRVDDLFEG